MRRQVIEIPELEDDDDDDSFFSGDDDDEETMPLMPDSPTPGTPDAKRKRGRPVGSKTVKRTKVRMSSREKVLQHTIASVNKDAASAVPPVKEMFRMMPDNQRKVKLGQLAIFCNKDVMATHKGSAWNEAMAIIAENSGGNNIVNLHSEVRLDRVKLVLKALLETGYMVHDIKVCLLKDGPDAAPRVYQIVSGRHRALALYMIYGPELELNVTFMGTLSYEEATYATIVSNDTREMGKTETVYFKGLMRELASATQIETEFKACRGKIKNIVDFAAFHSVIKQDLLVQTEIPVTDKAQRGSYTMTLVNWKNGVGAILNAMLAESPSITSNWTDAHGAMNVAIAVWNRMFFTLKEQAPDNPKISNAWTSYGSTVIGKILGDAIRVIISKGQAFSPEVISELTGRVAVPVLSYLNTPVGGKNFAHLPPSELYESLSSFASTNGTPLMTVPKKLIRF